MADTKTVKTRLTLDDSDYQAKIAKSKGSLIDFGAASRRVHGAAVTDVQATSGALRILDGGISNNIRSAERFLASIKGVGAAMRLIYPAVGLIAVGAVIAKGVTELTEFVKKTKEAGEQFRSSFQEMQNSSRLSNDELAKTNVNLENQIAKLTGKHENVLASQLIEARIEADRLATSAAAAAREMKDLLEKNQAGVLARVMGSGPTKEVFGNIENFQTLKSAAEQDQADALHRGDKAGADAAKQRYQQMLANERAYLQQQVKLRSGYVKYAQTADGPALVTADKNDPDATTYGKSQGDQTRNLDALRAALNLNYGQSDRIDLDDTNAKDRKALQAAEDAKNVADKAAAAQRKADEDHLRALKSAFELQKSAATMQPYETKENFEQRQRLAQSNFYLGHMNDFKTAAARSEVFGLGQKPLEEYNTTDAEGRAALQKMLSGQGSAESIFAGLGTDKDTQARLKAQQEAASSQAELANRLRETALAQEVEAGAISKHDAAVQMAALHTEQYQLRLEQLQAEAKQIASDPTLNEEQRRTKLIGIGAQIGDLGQTYDAQHGQDQQSIAAQTGGGALKQSMNQYIEQSRDTASQVRDIWSQSFAGINEQLEEMLSGQKTSWKSFLGGIAKDFANIFLQRGESAIMGSLFGEPGSKGGVGLTGIFSGIGALFSGLGFADGGMPPVGAASLVGERGPELFVPHSAGTIIPNHMLGNGGTVHNWNIDARGAGDPAMVKALVRQGIAESKDTLTALSMHAQQERAARKPSSRK